MTCTADDYVPVSKLVHSGQKRLYYAASCGECGWQHPQYRVTKERARDDFPQHLGASVDGDDQP